MFRAFDETKFWSAIEEKNYLRLKTDTVSSMLQDPTFARGETEEVIRILQSKVPEIFEEEVFLDFEERLDKADWDKGYFTKLTYWFQENFALSRLDYIREVGRVVHADTEAAYNQSMIDYQRAMQQTPTNSTPKTKSAAAKKQPVSSAQQTTQNHTNTGRTGKNPSQAPVTQNQTEQKLFAKKYLIAAVCALVLATLLLLQLLR